MTKKEIRVNKMWYTMWWQYTAITIAIGGLIIGIIAAIIMKDICYVLYGMAAFIPELMLQKFTFMAGDYYRERHPRYEE